MEMTQLHVVSWYTNFHVQHLSHGNCMQTWKRVQGQKDIYRIAAARDRAGKDIGQMRTIKSATGDVLMRDEDIRKEMGSVLQMADE